MYLSQIIASEKKEKEEAIQVRTKAENQFVKINLFLGLSRTYKPLDDSGHQLPPESTKLQLTVKEVMNDVKRHLSTLFDISATKDWSNCHAKADIVINGKVLVKDVPATYLLFLEKQLNDLLSLVKKIPTLDPAETWRYDEAQDCYASEPSETIRTKKVPRFTVAYEATDKHPAQVHPWTEDIAEGKWRLIKFSGAVPAKEVNGIIERISEVQKAVTFAREEANRLKVENIRTGEAILSYILG